MVSNAEQRAEAIYLETFSIVAANADFVEPEEGVDLLLEEALLASLAATILTSFLEGIFGELGKEFLEKVRQRTFRKGKLIETEPETLIVELTKRLKPEDLEVEKLARAKEKVKCTLQELGVAEEISDQMADAVLAVVEQHLHGD